MDCRKGAIRCDRVYLSDTRHGAFGHGSARPYIISKKKKKKQEKQEQKYRLRSLTNRVWASPVVDPLRFKDFLTVSSKTNSEAVPVLTRPVVNLGAILGCRPNALNQLGSAAKPSLARGKE